MQELFHVTTATVGDNQEKVGQSKQLLAAHEKMENALKEQKRRWDRLEWKDTCRRLEMAIVEQKVKIEEAMANYNVLFLPHKYCCCFRMRQRN